MQRQGTRNPKVSKKMVPLAGLEPALPKELDFESSASTNFTTGARMRLRLAQAIDRRKRGLSITLTKTRAGTPALNLNWPRLQPQIGHRLRHRDHQAGLAQITLMRAIEAIQNTGFPPCTSGKNAPLDDAGGRQ